MGKGQAGWDFAGFEKVLYSTSGENRPLGGAPVEVFPGNTDQLQQWTTTRTAGPSCSNCRELARLAISPKNNQSK